jgi:two-component system alkaline phosphatase synthesis response regulator PhoP
MHKNKILIVDDEKDILDLLEYNLNKEGYAVLRASDGESALSIVQSNPVDLILLDIMMPRLDGIETCRRLREMPEGQKTYIVFLTAREEEYSEVAGFEAGADDYIAKPIKPRILLSRIKAIFRRGLEHHSNPLQSLKVLDLEIIRDEYLVYKEGKLFKELIPEFTTTEFIKSSFIKKT